MYSHTYPHTYPEWAYVFPHVFPHGARSRAPCARCSCAAAASWDGTSPRSRPWTGLIALNPRSDDGGIPQTSRSSAHIKSFQVFLDMKPTINSQWPREALVPHVGNHCGVSLITRVLHLGSRLWPVTGAPARGGVRVRPTLANVGRAKRSFSTGFIRDSALTAVRAETQENIRDSGMCLRNCYVISKIS